MRIFLIIILYFSLLISHAQNRQQIFNLKNSLALQGYDPVSYFSGEPIEGSEEFAYNHKGIVYYFSSAKNKAAFTKEPDKYEPAYGGWCAYAMGESGERVKVDPETYKIIDGRLYLFYNFWGNNTLTDWNKNEKSLKSTADKNWTRFFH